MKYTIEQLRQVKGIGSKTIQRIVEQFDDSEYVSEYNKEIRIEPNTLINGDMLEVMNGIPDKSIDMILTDLPYGTTACSWDTIIPFDKVWKQYNRVIKDNGAIVLFGSEPFSTRLRMSNIDNYKYDWIWDKVATTNFLNANKQPLRRYENITVYYKKQANYQPIMRTEGKKRLKGGATRVNVYGNFSTVTTYSNKYFPADIIKVSNASRVDRLHPTQKPTELLEYLIETYTNDNDVVLDSTMGSGSTCVAAKNINRRYIGIEMDKEYFDIAVERVKK